MLIKISKEIFCSIYSYFFLFPANCELSEIKYICECVPTGALGMPYWKYVPIEKVIIS